MPLRLPELLILLAVVMLFFGAKKLPEMGASIGKTITEFKKGMSEIPQPKEEPDPLQAEHKSPEAMRQELAALERDIASKKAAAASYEAGKAEAEMSHVDSRNTTARAE